jgi:hypothetical protein
LKEAWLEKPSHPSAYTREPSEALATRESLQKPPQASRLSSHLKAQASLLLALSSQGSLLLGLSSADVAWDCWLMLGVDDRFASHSSSRAGPS